MTTAITDTGGRLSSVADLLARTDDAMQRGIRPGAAVVPTGFSVLDDALEGGLRSGELVLLGGPQGLGKTTMVMQMVRNVVRNGGSAVVFSFEHEGHTLLERLLSLEASLGAGADAARLQAIRGVFERSGLPGLTLEERLAHLRGVPEGLQTMHMYASRLHIHESTGATTDLEEIRRTASTLQTEDSRPPLVVVDYLQKVPVPGGPATEEERVTVVVERLKDLTLSLGEGSSYPQDQPSPEVPPAG
ncbi:MAG: DnaB-like helicase C-terminal domain-containing protein, partial [Lapillicoccus sp.]